jgi:hypothetical protein
MIVTPEEILMCSSYLRHRDGLRGLLPLLNEVSEIRYKLDMDDEVELADAILIWLFAEILDKKIFEGAELTLTLQMLKADLRETAAMLAQHVEQVGGEVPQIHLAFADRRYASLTGHNRVVDLLNCRRELNKRRLFVEGLSYNISSIAAINWKRIQEHRERTDAAHTDDRPQAADSRPRDDGHNNADHSE